MREVGHVELFVEALGMSHDQRHKRSWSHDDLEAALPRWLAAAEEARGTFEVDPAAFVLFLAERVAAGANPEMHADDMYLAFGCIQGCERATTHFFTEFVPELRALLTKRGFGPTSVDEALQAMLVHLLVGRAPNPPSLTKYAGRAKLLSFLRVVAVNEGLQQARRGAVGAKMMAGHDGIEHAADTTSSELMRLVASHRQQVRDAFACAVADLTDEEHLLLKAWLVDGAKLEELAECIGVSRATAARRRTAARARIVRLTYEHLAQRLGGSVTEAASLLRELRSKIEFSAGRLLGEGL